MTTINPTTPTKAPEINAECATLISIMEHLEAAWSACGQSLDAACGVLLHWESIDGAVMDGEVEAARLMRRTAESICPGLLAAAEVYGRHIEAGWPYAFDERRIRALFTTHKGRDPFGQPAHPA
jgi:hypothetical protein